MQSEFSKNYLINLDDKLQVITEYFVAFFGEKSREQIEKMINSTPIIFTGDTESWYKTLEIINEEHQKRRIERQEVLDGLKYVESLDEFFDCNQLREKELEYISPYLKNFYTGDAQNYIASLSSYQGRYLGVCFYDVISDFSEVKAFVHIPLSWRWFVQDKTIIHELLHTISIKIKSILDDTLVCCSGFKINSKLKGVSGEWYKTPEQRREHDILESFNETVTEYFTDQITRELKNNGFFIVNDESSRSIYDTAVNVMSYLFDRLGSQFRQAYITGDVEWLRDVLGDDFNTVLKINSNLSEFYYANTISNAIREVEGINEETDVIEKAELLPQEDDLYHREIYDEFRKIKQIADRIEQNLKNQNDKK